MYKRSLIRCGEMVSLLTLLAAVIFNVPTAEVTKPFGINDAGLVTGYFVRADLRARSFVREPALGTQTEFDYFGLPTLAQAINNLSQVTGFYLDGAGAHGFIREADGTLRSFEYTDAAGTHPTYPHAIGNAGQVAGHYLSDDFPFVHAFIYDGQNGFTAIDVPDATETIAYGINGSGAVAGAYRELPQ